MHVESLIKLPPGAVPRCDFSHVWPFRDILVHSRLVAKVYPPLGKKNVPAERSNRRGTERWEGQIQMEPKKGLDPVSLPFLLRTNPKPLLVNAFYYGIIDFDHVQPLLGVLYSTWMCDRQGRGFEPRPGRVRGEGGREGGREGRRVRGREGEIR